MVEEKKGKKIEGKRLEEKMGRRRRKNFKKNVKEVKGSRLSTMGGEGGRKKKKGRCEGGNV